METHKDLRDRIAQQIDDCEIGESNYLDCFISLRDERAELQRSLDLIKSFEQANHTYISDAISQIPEGYMGFDFEIRGGRTMFDYKHIPEWRIYDKGKRECEQKYKQAFLSRQNNLMVASEDGEELIYPTVNYGNGYIIMKKKK